MKIDLTKRLSPWQSALFGASFGLIFLGGNGLVMAYYTQAPDAVRRQEFRSSCRTTTCGAPQLRSRDCTLSTGRLVVEYHKAYHDDPSIYYQLRIGNRLFKNDSAGDKSRIAGIRSNYLCARAWSAESPLEVHALFWKGSLVAIYRDEGGTRQRLLTQAHPLSSSLYVSGEILGGVFAVIGVSAFFAFIFYGMAVKAANEKDITTPKHS